MKRFAKLISLALAACIIASALTVFGCKKPDDKQNNNTFGLTETQLNNILAISEAFAESGKVYDDSNALAVKEIERFIYYLYNGELTADSDGYGSVSADDAYDRLKTYFGIAIVRHTQKNDTDQPFYFSDNKYYIKTSSSVVTDTNIVSCEQDESGSHKVFVKCSFVDGTRIDLEFVFKIEGDATRVVSCKRYDEK